MDTPTNTRMGRPIVEGEQRTSQLHTLLEPSLAAHLRAWASAHGMTASGATRQAIMEMLGRGEGQS